MDTTVTGLFSSRRTAKAAKRSLIKAGFGPDEVRIIDSRTSGRHRIIADRTADSGRAVLLGTTIGLAAGAIAAGFLIGVVGAVSAGVVAGVGIAVGGALLGLAIGSATMSQVRDEIEHQVDSGTVLVSVTCDGARAENATELLVQRGGSGLVSTAATFTAGVLPATPGADR